MNPEATASRLTSFFEGVCQHSSTLSEPCLALLHITLRRVQGGAPSYRHNAMLMEAFGFSRQKVDMRISFGVGTNQVIKMARFGWAGLEL